MPQFDISTYFSQIFWLIIVFSILFISVNKFLTPKVQEILGKRDKIFSNSINEVNALNEKTSLLKELYNSKLNDINYMISCINDEAKTLIDDEFKKKNQELDNDLSLLTSNENEKIKFINADFQLNKKMLCYDVASIIIKQLTNKEADLALLKECLEGIEMSYESVR